MPHSPPFAVPSELIPTAEAPNPSEAADASEVGNEAERIVQAVRADPNQGAALLYDYLVADINRVVWKVLGADADHHDLVHDIFLSAWSQIGRGKLREASKLKGFAVAIAVNTVKKEIRKRHIRRHLLARHFGEGQQLAQAPNVEPRDVLRTVYTLCERMPPAERLVFSLRHLDEQNLEEVATLAGCSLSTAKRRLKKAEERFLRMAEDYREVRGLLSGTLANTRRSSGADTQ